jgi:hypothetical protein
MFNFLRVLRASVVDCIFSRPRFVDDVEGSFRRTAKAAEAGRGDYLADARLARLRAQAQSHFLRS